jgi:hypothetical protein
MTGFFVISDFGISDFGFVGTLNLFCLRVIRCYSSISSCSYKLLALRSELCALSQP